MRGAVRASEVCPEKKHQVEIVPLFQLALDGTQHQSAPSYSLEMSH